MSGELTQLLKAASEGDEPALNRLIALLYVDLGQLAHRCRRGDERAGEHYRKGGYFPGSWNGGAQLHSGIYSFTNGVQLTYVINGESSKAKLDISSAYNDSWS